MDKTMNHTYEYQIPGETAVSPNRFWFTPDQVAQCCFEHGRCSVGFCRITPDNHGGLVVTVRLTKALIESSCRADIGFFHGNAADESKDKYVHSDDGSLMIEIYEPPLEA